MTPDARRPVSFIDDVDLAYIMRRYREIHDLTHVTLGMPINMLGRRHFHRVYHREKRNKFLL